MNVDPNDFTPDALAKVAPICAECDSAERVTMVRGNIIYPHRHDLADQLYWRCECTAYVGVHRGTLKPLGNPAGKTTRDARQSAHAAFDPLWKKRQRQSNLTTKQARGRGYKWLAGQLGIPVKDCHIAMMDAATALRVAEICKNLGRAEA